MNVLFTSLRFNIKDHALTAIMDTIKTGHDNETIRLDNIGKKEALFKLGKGSL
jgi:hypothetical protein